MEKKIYKETTKWESYSNRGSEKRPVADLGEYSHGKRLGETLIEPKINKKKGNPIS